MIASRLFIVALAASSLWAALPAEIALGNRYLERTFSTRDGVLSTLAVHNKLAGRIYTARSTDFALKLVWERIGFAHGDENPVTLTAADFVVRDARRETAAGAETLRFSLENRRFRIGVDAIYTLGADDFYMRKRLEIRSLGRNPVFLDQIVVDDLELAGAGLRLGGFGQPVFADDLFMGLEYPGGTAGRHAGRIRVSYTAGDTTGERPIVSESAVLGVAPADRVRTEFQRYVSRIRSGPVRPVLVFNTWYDMQRDGLNLANSVTRMRQLKENLLDPYGIKLDSFVLDDGWDDRNSVWEIHARRFPGGFGELKSALEAQGSSLGLWFGPIGGYEQRGLRIAAGRKAGYEITANGEYFCLAGTKYREKFQATVLDLVRKYSITHLKFDGIPYGCNATGHGHMPGIYSDVAHLRAFIALLKAIRAADPKVFLNITTSNWLSPWWLMYTDVVFMGGMDYGFLDAVPAVSERDKAITYRDNVLYDDFRRHEDQFPNSSLMTIGIIKGTLGGEGGIDESLRNWTDNAVMNFSRGSMFTELYVTPSILKPAEWQALGRTIQWAQRNSDVLLADARQIGGEPGRREIYGYAHFGARGLVTLRNPFIEPRVARIPLDDSAGFPRSGRMAAQVIYPYAERLAGSYAYGDTLALRVEGYQTAVVEMLPESTMSAPAAGAHATPPQPAVQQIAAASAAAGRTVEGGFSVTLPAGISNARVAVLWESSEAAAAPSSELSVNGRKSGLKPVTSKSSEAGLGQGEGKWAFYLAPVSAGENRVDFRLSSPAAMNGQLSVWLLADYRREAKSPDSVLPIDSGHDYRTTHLFTRRIDSGN
jgi:hypothetical protein